MEYRWLLWVSIGLWIAGFILCVLGMQAVVGVEPIPFTTLITDALNAMFTAVTKITSGPTLGDQVQGLGSVLTYAGLVTFVIWVWKSVLGK